MQSNRVQSHGRPLRELIMHMFYDGPDHASIVLQFKNVMNVPSEKGYKSAIRARFSRSLREICRLSE